MNSQELNELKAEIYKLIEKVNDQVVYICLDDWAPIQIDETIGTLFKLSDLIEKYLEENDEEVDEAE